MDTAAASAPPSSPSSATTMMSLPWLVRTSVPVGQLNRTPSIASPLAAKHSGMYVGLARTMRMVRPTSTPMHSAAIRMMLRKLRSRSCCRSMASYESSMARRRNARCWPMAIRVSASPGEPPRVVGVQRLLRPRQRRRDLGSDLLVGVDVDHLGPRGVQVLERDLDQGPAPPPAEPPDLRVVAVGSVLGLAQQSPHAVGGGPLVGSQTLCQSDVEPGLEHLHADHHRCHVRRVGLFLPGSISPSFSCRTS